MYRYYSTQRPVMPGSYPKPERNKILEIRNFDDRIYVEEIGQEAWGYVDYTIPLTREDMNNYELKNNPEEIKLKYMGRDSWYRYVYEDEKGNLWKLTDCLTPREICESRGDIPVSSYGNTFDGEPDCPMGTHKKPIYIK